MATDYFPAYEKMIVREGGYKLTNDPTDRGGMTYAGVARNRHPNWAGWPIIDQGGTPPALMVRDFYRGAFWTPLRLDALSTSALPQHCSTSRSTLAQAHQPSWRRSWWALHLTARSVRRPSRPSTLTRLTCSSPTLRWQRSPATATSCAGTRHKSSSSWAGLTGHWSR